MIALPQILILTHQDFEKSNEELIQDDPGNPGQTFSEYVNMVVEDLNQLNQKVTSIQVNYNQTGDPTATIHYTIQLSSHRTI